MKKANRQSAVNQSAAANIAIKQVSAGVGKGGNYAGGKGGNYAGGGSSPVSGSVSAGYGKAIGETKAGEGKGGSYKDYPVNAGDGKDSPMNSDYDENSIEKNTVVPLQTKQKSLLIYIIITIVVFVLFKKKGKK
ncbi:MAG: hypothetical protein K9J13_13840 [Saprospiraceae bacterium]|nr:hypothetical protein [Saprospiraceae bacterium]